MRDLPLPAQAEEPPFVFKTDKGEFFVGPMVTAVGRNTLEVTISNKTECDFTSLSIGVEYKTGELYDGTPRSWADMFTVQEIKMGETKTAMANTEPGEGSRWKVLGVRSFDGKPYCPKEEEEKIRQEKEQQAELERKEIEWQREAESARKIEKKREEAHKCVRYSKTEPLFAV